MRMPGPQLPRLSVLNQLPSYGLILVRRHSIALSDRCRRRGRAHDFPDAAFRTSFSGLCGRTERFFGHCLSPPFVAKAEVADFKLFKPFGIDHGELDGLTPQQCFVLGYELAEIESLLKQGAGFQKPVHADNQERIRRFCEYAERPYRLAWMDGDPSESWMLLAVPPANGDADAAA
jgi:hypothetical protein